MTRLPRADSLGPHATLKRSPNSRSRHAAAVPRELVEVDVGGDRSTTAVCWINESYQVGTWIGHGDAAVLEARDVIRELVSTYTVREVRPVARWPAHPGARGRAARRDGLSRRRTHGRSRRATRLYRAVVEKRLTVPDDDELRAQVANTIARHSRRGWRLDKPSHDPPNDSIIALCMALDALENQPEPVHVVGWL